MPKSETRRVAGLLLPVVRLNQRYFFLQTAFAFHQHVRRFQAAEIQLVHNRQDVNFEEHRLYHRAFDTDVQPARVIGMDADEAAFELEQFQIIDKIAFDEAQAAQIRQFVRCETQLAQGIDFPFEIGLDVRQRIHGGGVAAAEFVHAVRFGKLVQHHLQHGEFI